MTEKSRFPHDSRLKYTVGRFLTTWEWRIYTTKREGLRAARRLLKHRMPNKVGIRTSVLKTATMADGADEGLS